MLVGADAFTAVLTDRLRTSLGPALHAAYLIGSAAMGEFRPGGSDLDVLVVTNRHLYRAEKERLVEAVSHRSLPSPARKLELVVYSLESLRSEPPTLDWEINLNTGPGLDDVSFDPSSEPRHWFVLDVAMAREHAEALWGPPSEEVFGPLDPPRVLEAMTDSIAWHRRHDTDGIDGVLNACRAWHYLETGSWRSKPAAGRWAVERARDPSVVEAALAARERGGGSLDADAVRDFVAGVEGRVLKEGRRARPGRVAARQRPGRPGTRPPG